MQHIPWTPGEMCTAEAGSKAAHTRGPWWCLPCLCALTRCCVEGMLLIAEETENSCFFQGTQPTHSISCRQGLLLLMNMHLCSSPCILGMDAEMGCRAWPPATVCVKHLSRVIHSGLGPPLFPFIFFLLRTRRKMEYKVKPHSCWASHCLDYGRSSLVAV